MIFIITTIILSKTDGEQLGFLVTVPCLARKVKRKPLCSLCMEQSLCNKMHLYYQIKKVKRGGGGGVWFHVNIKKPTFNSFITPPKNKLQAFTINIVSQANTQVN